MSSSDDYVTEIRSSFSYGVFGVLLLLVLFISVFRIVFDGEQISLYSLLVFLRDVPHIPTDWITAFSSIQNSIIISDWGIFQFFGNFLNFLTSLFFNLGALALYISVGGCNLVVFATYLVGFLFS